MSKMIAVYITGIPLEFSKKTLGKLEERIRHAISDLTISFEDVRCGFESNLLTKDSGEILVFRYEATPEAREELEDNWKDLAHKNVVPVVRDFFPKARIERVG
jgi:hypothetical protein